MNVISIINDISRQYFVLQVSKDSSAFEVAQLPGALQAESYTALDAGGEVRRLWIDPCPFPGKIKLRSQLSLAESESRRRGGRTAQQVAGREKTKQSTENVSEDPLENAPVKFP
jgi:hypothetical protein